MAADDATKIILAAISIDPEQYRFGHTKVQNPSPKPLLIYLLLLFF